VVLIIHNFIIFHQGQVFFYKPGCFVCSNFFREKIKIVKFYIKQQYLVKRKKNQLKHHQTCWYKKHIFPIYTRINLRETHLKKHRMWYVKKFFSWNWFKIIKRFFWGEEGTLIRGEVYVIHKSRNIRKKIIIFLISDFFNYMHTGRFSEAKKVVVFVCVLTVFFLR